MEKTSNHELEVLLTSDVAREAGVTPACVRVWADQGRLPATKTVSGRRLFSRADVDRFLAARRVRERVAQ